MRNFQGYFYRTFQDLRLQFPGLSRTKVLFQDFPGPGIFKKKIQNFPGLSRRRGNPVLCQTQFQCGQQQLIIIIIIALNHSCCLMHTKQQRPPNNHADARSFRKSPNHQTR